MNRLPLRQVLEFHSFWQGSPSRTSATKLQVMSFLHTQPSCTRYTLWLEQPSYIKAYELALSRSHPIVAAAMAEGRVRVMALDKADLSSGTPFEGKKITAGPGRAMGYSDLIRFMVLAKHGGEVIEVS